MADEDERREDPVLTALNTIIGEIRDIRAELSGLVERLSAPANHGEGPAPTADDASPGRAKGTRSGDGEATTAAGHPTLADLARVQGVAPIESADVLRGEPFDDFDAFFDAAMSCRERDT